MFTPKQIITTIRDAISLGADVRELGDIPRILMGLDPVDLYVRALCETLEAEQAVLPTLGIQLSFDRGVLASLLRQKAIDLSELPVAAAPLTQAIGEQVAALVLDPRFLVGVGIGTDVDLGWAMRVVTDAHWRYESKFHAQLPQEAQQLDIEFVAEQVSLNPGIMRQLREIVSWLKAMGQTKALLEPPIPLQRPRRAEHFEGREEELAAILRQLRPRRVVTLVGPGGVGKTALAAEAIWRLAPGDSPPKFFPDGILYHSFYGQPAAEGALEAIARAYGEEPRRTAQAAARRALAFRKALLVLDGTENTDGLADVLEVAGECGVLVATRRESDAREPPICVRSLPPEPAAAVLRGWAGAYSADEVAARQVCELVGRLPLAIRLAGSYMATRRVGVGDYRESLKESGLEALDHGGRQGQSVPLLMEQSVGQLSDDAREALAAVALLGLGSFGREGVAAALEMPVARAGRALGELVNYGLLTEVGGRYEATHRLIYRYARERLEAPAGALERLVGYLAGLARDQIKLGRERLGRLDLERPHILPLVEGCQARQDWFSIIRLACAVDDYLDRAGRRSDRTAVLEDGLKAAREAANARFQAALSNNLGIIYARQGELDRAIELYQGALEASQCMARTLDKLGILYTRRGEWDRAIELYQQSLETMERVGDLHGMAMIWGYLGRLYQTQGEEERAAQYMARALLDFRRLGAQPDEERATVLLARILGSPEAAQAYLERTVQEEEQGGRHG
jgi:tetratricopeptide (TPR) repeat protein